MSAVAGTAYFKVDGRQYSLRGSMVVALASKSAESVMGLDGRHGTKEIPVAPYIQCDITDQPNFDLSIVNNLRNVTVTVELINGKSCVLRNADQINHIELNADEGSASVRFEGNSGEWYNVQTS